MAEAQPLDFSEITTVIFDMDGTLIEHTWQLERITDALFSHFADQLAPVTAPEFFELFWPKNEDMWYMMVDGVLDGETAAKYSYVNTLRALGADTALAEPMVAVWNRLVLEEAMPFEDTLAVLQRLQGRYTTGIVTNGFTTLQRAKLERYSLTDYVDFTLVSEEAGYHKPDRRIFLRALELAGGPLPQETVYVGDSPFSDIQGAQGVGIQPILMSPRAGLDPPEGVPQIKKLSALLDLLGLED